MVNLEWQRHLEPWLGVVLDMRYETRSNLPSTCTKKEKGERERARDDFKELLFRVLLDSSCFLSFFEVLSFFSYILVFVLEGVIYISRIRGLGHVEMNEWRCNVFKNRNYITWLNDECFFLFETEKKIRKMLINIYFWVLIFTNLSDLDSNRLYIALKDKQTDLFLIIRFCFCFQFSL